MSATTETPLLEYEEEDQGKPRGCWSKFLDVEEAKSQVLFSVPMIITNVSYYMIPLISVMFAGHLGKVELAGASLANAWATVTGFALMTGLSGALETLYGQGYGSKSYRMLGIYLQASIVISFIVSIFISIVWLFSAHLLILLQQEPEIAEIVCHLHKVSDSRAICLCILEEYSEISPDPVCNIASSYLLGGSIDSPCWYQLSGFVSCDLFVDIFIMLALYVNYSEKFKCTWEGPSTECFRYIIPYMKLAIPSAVMIWGVKGMHVGGNTWLLGPTWELSTFSACL